MCSEVTAKEVGGKQLPCPRAAEQGRRYAGWYSRRLSWDKLKARRKLEMLPVPAEGKHV